MQDKNFWQFVCEQVEKRGQVVVVLIIETKGSSPRKTGTKMAIAGESSLYGSIGGGTMEHNATRTAIRMLAKRGERHKVLTFTHSDGPVDHKSGMVCAGKQKVLLYMFDRSDHAALQQLNVLAQSGEKFSVEFTPEKFRYAKVEHNQGDEFIWQDADHWRYLEIARPEFTVYLIGGGHVGFALSRALAPLDFRTILYDNRPGYAKFNENEWVDEKKIVDYGAIEKLVHEGQHVFVLILTSSHADDFAILQQLIDKQLGYIGFLASASKAAGFFNRLRKEGIAEGRIKQIRAPMGLLRKSYLPAEIAVSIVAELLQRKNEIAARPNQKS